MSDHRLRLLDAKHILIVENEYFVAGNVRRALEKAGAIVVGPAPSVEIGMKLIHENTIDGAILDIRLEGEAAFAIADRLQLRDIPFVFATAWFDSEMPGRREGYHLCEKPAELCLIAEALFGRRFFDH